MKYIISKIVGNDTIYVKSYRHTGRLGKYRVEYTPHLQEAMDFETANVAKLWAGNFTYSDGKDYHVEKIEVGLLAQGMA